MRAHKYLILSSVILIFTFVNPISADTTVINNSQINITAGVNFPDFVNHMYHVTLVNPDNILKYDTWIINVGSNPVTFTYVVNELGNWIADVIECDNAGNNCNVIIATQTITVALSSNGVYNTNMTDITIIANTSLASISNVTLINNTISSYNYSTSKSIYGLFLPAIFNMIPAKIWGVIIVGWALEISLIYLRR